MTYRIIYIGVEVTEWYGGVVTSLHGELIEVDGGLVKPCRCSCLEAAKFETSGSQRSGQANGGRLIHATSWEPLETFATESATTINLG